MNKKLFFPLLSIFFLLSISACQDEDVAPDYREAYSGRWKVEDNFTVSGRNPSFKNYTVTITSIGQKDEVRISNLSGFNQSLEAKVNSASLEISNQTFNLDGVVLDVTGTGYVEGEVLTLDYELRYQGNLLASGSCYAER